MSKVQESWSKQWDDLLQHLDLRQRGEELLCVARRESAEPVAVVGRDAAKHQHIACVLQCRNTSQPKDILRLDRTAALPCTISSMLPRHHHEDKGCSTSNGSCFDHDSALSTSGQSNSCTRQSGVKLPRKLKLPRLPDIEIGCCPHLVAANVAALVHMQEVRKIPLPRERAQPAHQRRAALAAARVARPVAAHEQVQPLREGRKGGKNSCSGRPGCAAGPRQGRHAAGIKEANTGHTKQTCSSCTPPPCSARISGGRSVMWFRTTASRSPARRL